MTFELRLIDTSFNYYNQVVMLRNEVLRKPLGLSISQEDIEDDKNQYIIISLDNEEVVGCLFVKIGSTEKVKFRQMAIAENNQHKGIGRSIISFAENFCQANKYKIIELHARKTALDFYLKQGYEPVGVEFEEVGIPHIKMMKSLIHVEIF
jgi:predicted GNAT family N-acyltransferase